MKEMFDLTAFQRDILYIVAGLEAPNGLEIMSVLEDYYGESITHGRLYQNLDTLDEKGLLHKESVDGRTNAYSLSPRGRREISDRREWETDYLGEKPAEDSSPRTAEA